jgi:hypothetical protein
MRMHLRHIPSEDENPVHHKEEMFKFTDTSNDTEV